MKLCDAATKKPEELFVIVVDEISRGDPSRVFGELLTYIEEDYRGREFTLSYSGKRISIPENIIIIATSNPYDRSIAEMDDAFIRRFYMVNIPPSPAKLEKRLKHNDVDAADIKKIMHFFDVLNEVLSQGFGHAHFWKIRNIDDLRDLWLSKISFLLERSLQFDDDKLSRIQEKFSELFDTTDEAVTPDATTQE